MCIRDRTQEVTYGIRQHQWTDTNHLLFIDSPIGVGFSIRDEKDVVNNSEQTAKDLHTFILRFFELFPGLKEVPLYIFGPSYAGHFVPSFAYEIYTHKEKTGIKLTGIGIGNGMIDALLQTEFYDVFAYSKGIATPDQREELKQMQKTVISNIQNGNPEQASRGLGAIWGKIGKINPGINIYNYRQYNHDYGDSLSRWANLDSVKKLLNIPPQIKFIFCAPLFGVFGRDASTSMSWKVEALMGKIKILIYSGEDDIIVNTLGTSNWVSKAKYPPDMKANWARVKKQSWKVDGKKVGTVMINKNFYYAIVFNSGHMVPLDTPKPAYDMMARFMNDVKDWTN
eukprot:TRINITY_DN9328_c0_g1_i1.p1 TRINITY_DN9328_c0_g1~~TRINITY_DN9328_c0_g1_i1.p1  ORF type:complete len:340 (-),score=60.53 TRINITY_DN9328_c0_g1_i1:122-1141(-)